MACSIEGGCLRRTISPASGDRFRQSIRPILPSGNSEIGNWSDWLASTVCSTGATVSALEKIKFGPLLWPVVQRSVLNNDPGGLVDKLKERIRSLPEREGERLRRIADLCTARLDSSH